MAYTGGSKAVRDFIKKYTDRGLLVDVYSRKWLEAHEHFTVVSVDDVDEYQEQSTGACEGHLLVLFTGSAKQELETDLLKIYKPFEKVFGDDAAHHKPDLVFVNLAMNTILCMGLGRKNRFFCYQLKNEISPLRESVVLNYFFSGHQSSITNPPADDLEMWSFISNFTKYDYANIVANLAEALVDFGEHASDRDHLPLNDEEIDDILDKGPDANGLYIIDGEEMTEQEVKNIQAAFEKCYVRTREHLDTFKHFFGEVYWEDLSTEDYF